MTIATRFYLVCFVCLAVWNARADAPKVDFTVEKQVLTDDFSKEIKRLVPPEIITDYTGPGMLEKSAMGVFAVKDGGLNACTVLYYPELNVNLPSESGKFLHVSFMLYGFGDKSQTETPLNCSARFFVTPKSELAKALYEPYSSYPNLNIIIQHTQGEEDLRVNLHEKADGLKDGYGKILYAGKMSAKSLPARFDLFVSIEKYIFIVNRPVSKLNGNYYGACGTFGSLVKDQPLGSGITLVNQTKQGRAYMTIDNFTVDYVQVSNTQVLEKASVTVREKFKPEDDPRWKLTWNDEFNGPQLDQRKWIVKDEEKGNPYGKDDIFNVLKKEYVYLDGQGNAVIKCDFDKDKKQKISGGIISKYQQRYGYFEARIKLTKQPGWWGSFWLWRETVGMNPFLHRLEIDIVEDFNKKGEKKNQNKQSLHANAGTNHRKSFATDVDIIGSWDDYHVFGMRWTPLEIVFFTDGLETGRWTYEDVVTIQGGQIYFTGCLGGFGSTFTGSHDDAVFPDYEIIDYVRVYAKDEAGKKAPLVKIKSKCDDLSMKKLGDKVKIIADVSDQDGKVKEVFLFDNGYLLESLKAPPYEFEVVFDEKYFNSKPYCARKPHAGGITGLDGEHVFAVLAKDNDGLVGAVEDPLVIFVGDYPLREPQPYLDKPMVLPGRLNLVYFDKGGEGVAYHDNDKKNSSAKSTNDFRSAEGVDASDTSIGYTQDPEWLKYTVQVEKAGCYKLIAPIATGFICFQKRGMKLYLNGKPLCELVLENRETSGWSEFIDVVKKGVPLPSGRHVITVRIVDGAVNIKHIDFEFEKELSWKDRLKAWKTRCFGPTAVDN